MQPGTATLIRDSCIANDSNRERRKAVESDSFEISFADGAVSSEASPACAAHLVSSCSASHAEQGDLHMRAFVVFMMLGASFAADASAVFRCVDSEGHVTFTNVESCPDGTVSASATAYKPERNTRARTWVEEEARQAEILRQNRGSSGRSRPQQSSGTGKSRTWRDDCRAARHRVEEQRLRTTTVTYDDLRRWNDIVFDACNGRHPDR